MKFSTVEMVKQINIFYSANTKVVEHLEFYETSFHILSFKAAIYWKRCENRLNKILELFFFVSLKKILWSSLIAYFTNNRNFF